MRKSRHSPETRAQAIRLAKDKSQTEVSEELGVSLSTINYWVNAEKVVEIKTKNVEENNKGWGPLASITFGGVLARLRIRGTASEKIQSTDDFARRIGIGGSSLRMMESGHHVPQIKLAYPLALECKLSLPMTVIVISFVRIFDSSDTIDDACKFAKIFIEQEPRLAFFARRLVDAAHGRLSKCDNILKKDELVINVLNLMESRSMCSGTMVENMDPIFKKLSPVLMDAVLSLSSRLKIFNPALDMTSLNNWENENSERIRRAWSYYNDAANLLETIDSFDCKFINPKKAIRPQYIIIFKQESEARVNKLKQELLNKLGIQGEDSNVIAINDKRLPTELIQNFERALYFDLHEGVTSLCFDDKSTEELASDIRSSNNSRYTKMSAINLYELDNDDNILHCAFADNLNHNKSNIYYARALKMVDTEELYKLFIQAQKEIGVNH